MHTADLYLYPAGEPMSLKWLDCDRCLQFLLPYIDDCRASGRVGTVVAEISFSDGCVVWFGSKKGVIDMNYERPIFGGDSKWLRLLPVPNRQHTQCSVANMEIQQLVSSMYKSIER